MENTIKVNIDTKDLYKLRYEVDKRRNFCLNREHEIKVDKAQKKYYAWDRICVIMDRLENTVQYINSMELGKNNYQADAFDFYDFISNAYIVINCIKTVATIFNTDYSEIEKKYDCFNQKGTGTGNDYRFFEYIRSLVAVHPMCTNHQHEYLDGSIFHCCPYVVWENDISGTEFNSECDLTVIIYDSKFNSEYKHLGLKIIDFEKYINKWMGLIPTITSQINLLADKKTEELKNLTLQKPEEFNCYNEYLSYLDNVMVERYACNWDGFKRVQNIFNQKFKNLKNIEALNKYQNALKYAIGFTHNWLQNMSQEGFDNTGIIDGNGKGLLECLLNPDSPTITKNKWYYNISKIEILQDSNSYYEKLYAYSLLKPLLPFISEYVVIDELLSDYEIYLLVQISLYLDCLENNCIINRNIPNELNYRYWLYSEEDWVNMQKVFRENVQNKRKIYNLEENIEKLNKILEQLNGDI